MNKPAIQFIVLIFICTGCYRSFGQGNDPAPVLVTSIEVIDPELAAVVNADAKIEKIADGLDWCEGPLWVGSNNMLLFSDVPKNIIYKWTKDKGKEVYLSPSGYNSNLPRSGGGEIGSNGLALNGKGQLLICQHGNRSVSVMDAPLDRPQPKFIPLAGSYSGKKFDSPNDLTVAGNGDIYFTDPPYGLAKSVNDPLKEAPYQGVYKISNTGAVTLLTDTVTRPNGIAFFPDGKAILVANSDARKPYWYIYDVDQAGMLNNGRIFYNAKDASATSKGLPDGLKIDKKGYVFASGPGGIWIFNRTGKLLGKIRANVLLSNCAFSGDERTLYITADMYVLKVDLR